MGWVAFVLIGVAALVAVRLLGLPRDLWAFVAAALMLGGAGYALQGSPGLPGHPVKPDAMTLDTDPGITRLRAEMFGAFTPDESLLTSSDALIRAGASDLAVKLILGGIRQAPKDAALWTALGDALATHDGGSVSPAALFAYQHAAVLAPDHPGPPFFLGLDEIRSGNLAAARPLWAHALALTPQSNPYRPEIAVRLDLLDRYLAMAGAMPQ